MKEDVWEYEADLPQTLEFRLIKGPWQLGEVVIFSPPNQNCGFAEGDNQKISGNTMTVRPQFDAAYSLWSCARAPEKAGNNINFFNLGTRQCLSDNGAKAKVSVSHCTFNSLQNFTIEELEDQDAVYTIKNSQNLCLEVEDASEKDGAYVRMAPCTDGKNQQIVFRVSPNNSAQRNVVFLHSKMYQWSCHKEINQDFFINRGTKKDKLPRIVWSFWDKAGMPAFYKANIEHWKHVLDPTVQNEWRVIVLNDVPGHVNY